MREETAVLSNGYRLFPEVLDFSAYSYIFKNPRQLIDSYGVTISFSLFGTLISMLLMTLMAYPLSRPVYLYRKQISFLIFFTMLFNGGLIPTYILNTRYLNLGDTIWIYMLPNAVNAFYIIVIRTFFQNLPSALVESAKIDGASELRIFFRIILPLSKPVVATVSLLILLARWNDWNTSLIYIKSKSLFSLQYLLQKTLMEAQFIRDMATLSPITGINLGESGNIPTETIKFAMCIVAAGPMVVIFPFFQKYFTTGLTVGAVKG
jgi:putative aldouronate transport system permease protein